MKFAVLSFPGSNCDDDMMHVLGTVMQADTVKVWHKDIDIPDFTTDDCIVVPGGFSYGDYLRAGAIAKFSPIMQYVQAHAAAGGMVIGICNGFQILCECGLLPGVLLNNAGQKFIGKDCMLKVEHAESKFTTNYDAGAVLRMPVAHAEGRYYAPDEVLDFLEKEHLVLFRYCDKDGAVNDASNLNGSLNNIAGIRNKEGNVFGMMPHPERAAEAILGNADGLPFFESILNLHSV